VTDDGETSATVESVSADVLVERIDSRISMSPSKRSRRPLRRTEAPSHGSSPMGREVTAMVDAESDQNS
jgi:hypothetical protein